MVGERLPVIITHFNPSNFTVRNKLTESAKARLSSTSGVDLFVVELVYGEDARFEVTNSNNDRHLQLRMLGRDGRPPAFFYAKENLANIAVARLLPAD